MIRTANPALNDKNFGNYDLSTPGGETSGNVMTMSGAVNKTTILLVLVFVAAAFAWHLATNAAANIPDPQQRLDAMAGAAMPWMIGGIIAGFVIAIVTIFAKKLSPFTAPLYAVAEGVALGALSCVINAIYEGIAVQAVGATLGVLAVMLLLYTTRIIKPTKTFIMGVTAATGGLMLFYLVAFVASFFGVSFGILAFNNGSPISIGFSVIVVILAALNLVLDFKFIEDQASQGAPKYMEWFAAFGLLVTLVWLYIEILRLLAKIQSRD